MTSSAVQVVVADDESLGRERLRRLLYAEKDFQLVGEARTGSQAVGLISALRPAIALLDIRLPGLNGFEVLKALGQAARPSVIFVTAFGDYAVEAFQAGAVDYLLKPFDAQRLRVALQRAQRHSLSIHTLGEDETTVTPDLLRTSGKIALRVAGRTILLALNEIQYVLACNARCEVQAGRQKWLVNESLGSLYARLPADQFVRVSRFALVNLSQVIGLRTKSHGDQILELIPGVEITLARTYRLEVLARLPR